MADPWAEFRAAPQQRPQDPWAEFRAAPIPPAGNGFVDGAIDFAKSIPGGLAKGVSGFANLAKMLTGADEEPDPIGDFVGGAFTKATSNLPRPEGRAGRFGEAAGEVLGNPITWAGPGTLALKAGAGALSALGGEAAGQAAEGTKYEGPARFAGSVAGGLAGVKALGTTAPKAAIPDYKELKAAATADYNAARASGLELRPQGLANFAGTVERELAGANHGFSGGKYGDAPGTFDRLAALQNPPAGTVAVSAENLDALRRNLARLARTTSEGKPTPDAAAASIALERLNTYLESVPKSHIMAGNAEDYVRATKQGNANYSASQRLRTIDLKRARAENNAEGGVATSLDNQIKSQMRTILNNPKAQRGFSPEELDQISKVNSGTLASNTMRQLGRGGAGVVPAMGHITAAAASGGATVIPQLALAAGLYGARKGAEAMTVSQANKLAEMLAKRSPEFEKRLAALPGYSSAGNQAQMIRSIILGLDDLR